MKLLFIVSTLVSFIFTKDLFNGIKDVQQTPEEIIRQDFATIDTTQLKNFIPFRQNNKWGYMHRVTKKVIVTPKYKSLSFFNPAMEGYYESTYFMILKSGKILFDKVPFNGTTDPSVAQNALIKVIPSSSGFKGFTVNAKGELATYSSLYYYYTTGYHTWNVYPFKDHGKQLAVVVNKEGLYGIIDTQGNIIKGFEFKYKKIIWNRLANDPATTWFFINMEANQWSMMSLTGQHKLDDQKLFNYPFTSNSFLGYTPMNNEGNYKVTGIFDCVEMKWVLKAQHSILFWQLYYSSDKVIHSEDIAERKNVYIYYPFEQEGTTYYIDLQGIKYIPQ